MHRSRKSRNRSPSSSQGLLLRRTRGAKVYSAIGSQDRDWCLSLWTSDCTSCGLYTGECIGKVASRIEVVWWVGNHSS